jgi:hypothetical protein
VLIAAASLVVLRARVVLSAVGWGGLAIAVVVLEAAFVYTAAVFLVLLWVVAVGGMLAFRRMSQAVT